MCGWLDEPRTRRRHRQFADADTRWIGLVHHPDLQELFSRDEQWSLAVMCPAFQRGLT
jgi:hypothetical protein